MYTNNDDRSINPQTPMTGSGNNGTSGYDNTSGYNGTTGYNGNTGNTGYSSTGYNGTTGYSSTGYNGTTGYGSTGYNGTTGYGSTGYNGTTGYGSTGYNGSTGYSNTGYNGSTGYGSTGYNGTTGYGSTGYNGTTGYGSTGYNGTTGYGSTGYNGTTGYGNTGYNGTAGYASTGYNGSTGYGNTGYNGTTGYGNTGYNGTTGYGSTGYNGTTGYGSTGYNGTAGYNGTYTGYNSSGNNGFYTGYNSTGGYGNGTGYGGSLSGSSYGSGYSGAMTRKKRSFSGAASVIIVLICLTIGVVLGILDRKYSDNSYYGGKNLDDMPKVTWNKNDEEACYRELSRILLDTPEKVVIIGNGSLTWADVCKYNFWVSSFSVWNSDKDNYYVYQMYYKKDAANCKVMQQQVDSRLEKIVSEVPDGADDWEKLVYIHDVLAETITYDEDADQEHTYDIYGALVDQCAVCQGYTYAFSYIARELGLESDEIYSDDHVWNKSLSLSTTEQYIDVTWDDTDVFDRNGREYISHICFGLSKAEMEELSSHTAEAEEKDKQTGSGTGDNYFRRTDSYIAKGDYDALNTSVSKQFQSGSNIIEVRYESADDYASAEDDILDYLYEAEGYNDYYYIWNDDKHNIVTIGLYAPAEDIEESNIE